MPIAGMLLGGLFFFIIYGPEIVDPAFIGWTMDGDAAQHFLGWHFFRTEPWTFPVGVINAYQAPQGTSLVYTDSIPLLAIPLKLLSPLLPAVFQFHGLWLLINYGLQGYFAVLLLRQITKQPQLIFLAAAFFLLSPVLVHRARVHESLTAHWIILASLYLYFRADTPAYRIKWVALLLMAALVHFYLLAMALLIFLAYLLKQLLHNEKGSTFSLIGFAVTALTVTVITMWTVGYFVFDVRFTGSGGFGNYSMNLLAPVNASPIDGFVGDFVFLNPIPLATTGQLFEGFNYLGFGLLLLIVYAGIVFLKHRTLYAKVVHRPLILVGLLLLVMSLSSKVTLADTVLLEMPLPYTVEKGLGILRSSGRMFWPISYMLTLAAVGIVIKCHSTRRSMLFLLVFLSFQLVDFSPWYRNVGFGEMSWDSPLRSHLWEQLMDNSEHVVFVPPNPYDPAAVPFAFLAANQGSTINVGTTARTDLAAREAYVVDLLQAFEEGQIEEHTLYVIRDERYLIAPGSAADFTWGTLDGYTIIAPRIDSVELAPWPN